MHGSIVYNFKLLKLPFIVPHHARLSVALTPCDRQPYVTTRLVFRNVWLCAASTLRSVRTGT
jgi:hypothetical protein